MTLLFVYHLLHIHSWSYNMGWIASHFL